MSETWIAALSAAVTGLLSLAGVYLSNRRSAALIAYRLEQLERKQSVHNGAIITFDITRSRVGTTSVTYEVNVTGRRVTSTEILHVFSTHVTMCAIDGNGQKTPLPPLASPASPSSPSAPSSSSCPSSRSCPSSQASKENQA